MLFEFHGPRDGGARVWSQWVAKRIPNALRGWRTCTVMRVYDHNGTKGCVVFHDWNPEAGTMCMSAASAGNWLTRDVITAMHSYIFDTADCQAAVLQVSEHNDRMNRIARRIGYEPHRIPRLRGRDEAEIVWVLTEETWRESRFRRAKFSPS